MHINTCSYQATYHHIREDYVLHYISQCRTCAARPTIRKPPAGQPIYAKGPMELVAIDLFDMSGRPDREYKYVLHVSVCLPVL
jgi:hypothetical protein